MIRLSMASISIFIAVVVAIPAMMQEQKSGATQSGGGGEVLGTVVRGNATIVFGPAADTRDIDMGRLRTWGEFAERHPKVANALAHKPSLIDDGAYLKKHPDLEVFFQAHPDIKGAMKENSGNFVAIPPRSGE